MREIYRMLRRCYHLIGSKNSGFKTEVAGTEGEQVFQTGSEEFYHHDVVVAFYSPPIYAGDSYGFRVRVTLLQYSFQRYLIRRASLNSC